MMDAGNTSAMVAGVDDPEAAMQGLHDYGDLEAARPEVVLPSQGHDWQWSGKAWRCRECLRMTRDRRKGRTPCVGAPESVRTALLAAGGNKHQLMVARDENEVCCIWCRRCGCWAGNRAIGLKEVCREPTRQGKTCLNRVRGNLHPEYKTRFMMQMPLKS